MPASTSRSLVVIAALFMTSPALAMIDADSAGWEKCVGEVDARVQQLNAQNLDRIQNERPGESIASLASGVTHVVPQPEGFGVEARLVYDIIDKQSNGYIEDLTVNLDLEIQGEICVVTNESQSSTLEPFPF